MGKTVIIDENRLLNLKEELDGVGNGNVANTTAIEMTEARPEVDEYEIGDEGSNPPIGGNFYHVNESYNCSVMGDMKLIDYIDYIPHSNPREEGYTVDNITEFEPHYELECYGNDGDMIFCGDLTLNELFDYFPDKIVHAITGRNGRKVSQSQWRIEDILSWDTTPKNIDDVEEVNAIAKRIQTGGPSIYLLVDGEIISFHDHINITTIDGMTPSKFVGLGNIRTSGEGIEVAKKPTREQIQVLRQLIRRQDKIYLDIVKDEGKLYPQTICSAFYSVANADRIINDIMYYFEDGIRPQGMVTYESKCQNDVLNENDSAMNGENLFNLAIQEFGLTNNLRECGYILPNGTLLKLGHDGYRDTDHRAIEGIYLKNNINIWDNEYRYNYVVDFMNHGAIRCDVNIGLIDMTNEPTNEQYSVLKTFIRKAEDVDIDFTDNKGNTVHSVSYSNVLPSRVVADIYKYYNEGIKPIGNVALESKEKMNVIDENFDFEVNSSDISLSSFKKKSTLAPNIWDDNDTLNSRVRLRLLDIADDFWKFVNLTWVKPNGIIITGSICNYNWSQYSDIDLHLIVDFNEIDEKTNFVRDYLDAKKNEWNDTHSDLKIYNFPIELYVQDINDELDASGIYDLEENKWIRKPNMSSISSIGLNKFNIKDKAAEIMTIIDDMYGALNSTDDSHDIETIGEDAKYLWKKVKKMRKKSLEKHGESGSGNVVYKILRRTHYLDKLWKISNIVYDKVNSITENYHFLKNESLQNYLNLLKEATLNEEIVADGNSEHNPYAKRWKAERKALKDFICNFGKIMTSRENGKLYKVYYDRTLSQLIGYNYCICLQWNPITLKPSSTLYIRALDKFTNRTFQAQYDTRGMDNQMGTMDDNFQQQNY